MILVVISPGLGCCCLDITSYLASIPQFCVMIITVISFFFFFWTILLFVSRIRLCFGNSQIVPVAAYFMK
ncbi:hypothetical protein BKA70DRAFT_407200 [Coprinopsis sp. MPI-PUGE-AT-0042]|nr:hypothetical protein BKA70DRAFT_407200 [Coprinopsis sp. MPI-PUGE-AT-0042]